MFLAENVFVEKGNARSNHWTHVTLLLKLRVFCLLYPAHVAIQVNKRSGPQYELLDVIATTRRITRAAWYELLGDAAGY
jgi:hypothetical protein